MEQSQNTKIILAGTLKEMMSEKPFDRITVSELTKRCGLNRQTFYYHFSTIVDLFHWLLQEEISPLLNEFHRDPYHWKDALLRILYYVKENSRMVQCALRSINNMEVRAFFTEYFRSIFMPFFDFICRDLDVDADFKNFIMTLHITGAVGLAVQWLESGTKENPEQITEWLAFYLEGNVRGTFERYALKKGQNLKKEIPGKAQHIPE